MLSDAAPGADTLRLNRQATLRRAHRVCAIGQCRPLKSYRNTLYPKSFPARPQSWGRASPDCSTERHSRGGAPQPVVHAPCGRVVLFDSLRPFEASPFEMRKMRNEYLALTLEAPPIRSGLVCSNKARRGAAMPKRRCRAPCSPRTEGFNQLNRLGPSSERNWSRPDRDCLGRRARATRGSARRGAPGRAVRSHQELHRAERRGSRTLRGRDRAGPRHVDPKRSSRIRADPAGSISNYVWLRRLSHCAASLRDPTEADRSITDLCSHLASQAPRISAGSFTSTSGFRLANTGRRSNMLGQRRVS